MIRMWSLDLDTTLVESLDELHHLLVMVDDDFKDADLEPDFVNVGFPSIHFLYVDEARRDEAWKAMSDRGHFVSKAAQSIVIGEKNAHRANTRLQRGS